MKKGNGFAHIFLILFLLAGLAVGVYLVQQKTNILPKAYEPNNAGIGSTAPIGIGSTAPGLQVSINSIQVTVRPGGVAVKAFDITNTGSLTGFVVSGYPTAYGPGINFDVSTGGINTGQTVPVSIYAVSSVRTGIYTGTAIIKDYPFTREFRIPVTVMVSAVPAKPVNLSARCDKPFDGSWETVLQWDQGDSNDDFYFVRYKEPGKSTWFPYPNPAEGATPVNHYQFTTELAPVLERWGVYACNANGCSDFAAAKSSFNCTDFSPMPVINNAPRPSSIPTPWAPRGINITAPIPQD